MHHHYRVGLEWTGDLGVGTAGYRRYSRDHRLTAPGKPEILGSSDPAFRGDPGRWNPEDLLLASLSGCHQLWWLHLCAEAGIIVTAYSDDAEAFMVDDAEGGGRFVGATLRPRATISAGDPARALALHHDAHERCFIANSVNFPVAVEPAEIIVASRDSAPSQNPPANDI